MKKKKHRFRFHIKSKHLLVLMTLLCISCIVTSYASGKRSGKLADTAAMIVVPFQTSIERISSVFENSRQLMREKQELVYENAELKAQVESLTAENNKLIKDQSEYLRLKKLYTLDQEYSDYPKVAASIISKDPGNWYNTFMINKGSRDGIRVDNNVLAGKGLVGIVTQVGETFATVRAIIDDSSNVSGMTVGTSDNLVVQGDLELIDQGLLRFSQLYDEENKVTIGERVVTSNISEKYVEGLFIGYVNEVTSDTNNLTKTGTIVTPVDFRHLKHVFVITVNKKDVVEGTTWMSGNTMTSGNGGISGNAGTSGDGSGGNDGTSGNAGTSGDTADPLDAGTSQANIGTADSLTQDTGMVQANSKMADSLAQDTGAAQADTLKLAFIPNLPAMPETGRAQENQA